MQIKKMPVEFTNIFLKNYLKPFFITVPKPTVKIMMEENIISIRSVISTKKPSGTIFIKLSVAGSSIHKSLLKKIWWKIIKYFSKSPAIRNTKTAVITRVNKVPNVSTFDRKQNILPFNNFTAIMQRILTAISIYLR